MEKQDIFSILRTDIGEEGVEKQLEQERRKLRRKRKRLREQVRMEMEALGLQGQQQEDAEQAAKHHTLSSKTSRTTKTDAERASVHQATTSSKSSKATKPTVEAEKASGSTSAQSKRSSAKSSVSAKRTPEASLKGSRTPTAEAQAKPEEAVEEQPEGEPAPVEGAWEQGPEQGGAEKEAFDMFPEYGDAPAEGKQEPTKEAEPEAQRWLIAALVVLATLALIVMCGLFLYAKPFEVLTNGTILKVSPCSSPGCIKAKALSDSMLQATNVKQGGLHPCNRFYEYSCGGWAARNLETSTRTSLNEVLVNMMNRTLSTANLDTSEHEPYRNMILFYRSCIEFHTTTMPTDVRVRKALYLLDLSFTEWLYHNQEPIILFYFMIRLSLSQGINTLLKLRVVEKNREARVVMEVGMSAWQKFSTATSRKFDERTYKLYMSDALFSLDIPNITDKVIQHTLSWDEATTTRHKLAMKDFIHEHTVYDLIQGEGNVTGADWLYAINDNLPPTLRLKNNSHMDTHNLTYIAEVISEFFSKSKIELVTYVFTLAIAELLRYDFNREHRYIATCLKSSYENFPEPLRSLFVNKHLKKSVIDHFRIFFENIKTEVQDSVSTYDWMDQNTRIKARVKINTVGLRTVESTTRELNPDEEPMSGDFLSNYVVIARYNKKRANRYPEPSQKFQQNLDLIIGNVKVDYEDNEISVPARDLLEPVFYEDAKEKFVNLSALGTVVAAEVVSVAFSPSGSRFAAGGLKIDWWPERVATNYQKRLNCYESEYAQLRDAVTLGNSTSSGPPSEEVLEYLMTYSRGLEIAYKMADISDNKNKQLFFTRFCQMFCNSNQFKNTHARSTLNVKLACMYPMLHSEGFREAFECDHTHTLYPKKSCPLL
ncbi:membrane metallo-endopeptidase-like 1 [Dermacentor variabilis]|uniref:membrane metallo-endopeptidase-like 1 n=1 Tax=Dermacentor variabilis TaxID=34621 RepID=UPI003F5BC8EB